MSKQSINLQLEESLINQIQEIASKKGESLNNLMEHLIEKGIFDLKNPPIYIIREDEIAFHFQEVASREPTKDEIKKVLKEIGSLDESLNESTYPILEELVTTAVEDMGIRFK